MRDIFVSYARADSAFALKLASDLRAAGIALWIDQLDIAPGTRWDREVEVALKACPAMLVVLTPAAVASDNVLDEVGYALDHGKIIVPVLAEPCEVPLRLRRLQHIDFTRDAAGALARCREELTRRLAGGATGTGGQTPRADAGGRFSAHGGAGSDPHARIGLAAQEWPAVRDSRDAQRLARFAQHFAGTYYAEEARALGGALEAETQRQREEEARFRAEGRIPVLVGDGTRDRTAWAKPGAGEVFRDIPAGPEMVVVPAGRFTMGAPPDEPERQEGEVQVPVTITRPLAVGRFAVTFDEWDAAIAAGGVAHTPADAGWGRGKRPVINVSWDDAQAYAAWLSKATGKAYRLLSEAEWEYCCRAGTATPFWWGPSISTAQANHNGNHTYAGGAKGDYRQRTVPVGSFAANLWGLHNVHGNAWEWCADSRNESNAGNPGDGGARTTVSGFLGSIFARVLRGGSTTLRLRYLAHFGSAGCATVHAAPRTAPLR